MPVFSDLPGWQADQQDLETVRVGVSGRQPVDPLPCLSLKARPAHCRDHRYAFAAYASFCLSGVRDIAAIHMGDEIDIFGILADIARMAEKDIYIVARLAGIPLAGCRDADHAN